MPNVIYRVQVSGVEQARAQVASVPAAANASMTSLSQRAGSLADAFKVVSRDIGTLGGSTAQAFTHMADEALSVVGILTGGAGITAGIAAIGLAVGGLSALWQSEEAAMKRATEEKKGALEATRTLVSSIAKTIIEEQGDATEAQVVQLRAEIDATDRVLTLKRANLLVTNSIKGATIDEVLARTELVRTQNDEIGRMEKENAARAATIDGLEKELEKRARMARQREEQERREREAAAKLASQEAARFRGEAGSIGGVVGDREKENRIARIGAAQRKALLDEANAAEILRQAKQELAEADAEEEEAKKKARAERAAAWEEMEQQLIREKQLREDAARAAEEQERAVRAAQMAQIAQSVTKTVAGPVIAQTTDLVGQLASANRATYEDMEIFTESFPALVAAKAQAILAGIAVEATGRAAMEAAEALAMAGLGLGYLAIPGMQGFAGPAFASAAQHGAAAAVFGGLAGVTLGGAMAVGAMRGPGGLVPLTNAEQASMGGGYGSAGGGTRGTSGGSYNGGGERGSGGPVVINITNEPGSMPPDDQDRAAMAVARHVRRAQQDWFTSQEMGG
jgi:hypothetical protein